MTPREFMAQHTRSRSTAVGVVAAVLLYGTSSLEVPILVATIMPGIYWGFAYRSGSWLEILEESLTCGMLVAVYGFCLRHVRDMIYLAPVSIGIHGLVDLCHHFQMYPSERHVHACAPEYPLVCGTVDLALCATLSALLYFFGS